MAVLTWYLTNTVAQSSLHQGLSEANPNLVGMSTLTVPQVGWTVGKLAVGGHGRFATSASQTVFTSTNIIHPDGVIGVTASGDSWRTEQPYLGQIAAGTWRVQNRVIGVDAGGSQDGYIAARIHKAMAFNGSGATQLTAVLTSGAAVTNLSTAGDGFVSLVNISLGAVNLSNEYLFIEVGWRITGAGGAAGCDVIYRVGVSGTIVVTPDFTSSSPAPTFVYYPTDDRGLYRGIGAGMNRGFT